MKPDLDKILDIRKQCYLSEDRYDEKWNEFCKLRAEFKDKYGFGIYQVLYGTVEHKVGH